MLLVNNKPCGNDEMFESKKRYNRNGTPLTLIAMTYHSYDNTALLAETVDGESYATISVNISPLMPNCFAVDINNCPTIDIWLEENNIATNLGTFIPSGYVTYPIYKLTDEFLNTLELRKKYI